jgi:hypothetical protein
MTTTTNSLLLVEAVRTFMNMLRSALCVAAWRIITSMKRLRLRPVAVRQVKRDTMCSKLLLLFSP